MHIRCPHCRNPIEVVEEAELSDVTCPSCGSSFNLLPDATVDRHVSGQRTLGRFELVDRIGFGSFGEVWSARDSELDRIVAIKMPRKGQLTAEESEGFLREARAAARLHHASIVAVHEVGKQDDQLFIVSDYVHGLTLADWLTGKQPTPEEAAELCAKIADAIHHAHEHGVIHRDLKPSNVMIDDDGQPHIMDFGLAKRDAGEITMTLEGRVLGTPAYMSPEQAKGAAHDADSRSDVYSAGVILFEMLTGELPFRGNARMLIHQVINDEPPSPRRFNASVPRDLETIVLMALEKLPSKRYATAREMADDLRRFVRAEPIAARPISQMERAARWLRRKPLVAGLGAALVGVLLAGTVISSCFAILALKSGTTAVNERQRAEAESRRNRRLLYASDMQLAGVAWQQNDTERVKCLLHRHRPVSPGEGLPCFEWFYLWRLYNRSEEMIAGRIPQPGGPMAIAFSPDGKFLAAYQRGSNPTLTELETGRQTTLRHVSGSGGAYVVYSRDGERLVYPGPDINKVIVRDLSTSKEVIIDHGSPVTWGVDISPCGELLATGSFDGTVKLWNAHTGDNLPLQHPGHNGEVGSIKFSSDGRFVATSGGTSVMLWGMNQERVAHLSPSDAKFAQSLCFSPDGTVLAAGTRDGRVLLWQWESGRSITLPGHSKRVLSLAFSRSGARLASGGEDKSVRIWDMATCSEVDLLRGNSGLVHALAFSPTEESLLASGGPSLRAVVLWDLQREKEIEKLDGELYGFKRVAFTQDGKGVVTLGFRDLLVDSRGTDLVNVWNLTSGQKTAISAQECLESIEVSSAWKAVALGESGQLYLSDLRDLKEFQPLPLPKQPKITDVACSSDGGSVIVGRNDGTVTMWDIVQRRSLFERPANGDTVTQLAFSRDHTLLAIAGSRTVGVWNLRTREKQATSSGFEGGVYSMAFKRDNTLMVGTEEGTVESWNWMTSERQVLARGLGAQVRLFLDDGNTAVTLESGLVRFWDVMTNQERFGIEFMHCLCLGVSPDEKTFAVGMNWGGGTRILRAATLEEVRAAGW